MRYLTMATGLTTTATTGPITATATGPTVIMVMGVAGATKTGRTFLLVAAIRNSWIITIAARGASCCGAVSQRSGAHHSVRPSLGGTEATSRVKLFCSSGPAFSPPRQSRRREAIDSHGAY